MSKKNVFSTASSNRRQSLLQPCESYRQTGTRLGEVVGGTTAVCCCFSFGIANIVYLTVCKLPVSLCQKMLRNKRRHRLQSMREELMPSRRQCICGCCDDIIGAGWITPLCCDDADLTMFRSRNTLVKDKEVIELEREMWERFYDSGFWRSSSQREDSSFSSSPRIAPAAPNLQVVFVN